MNNNIRILEQPLQDRPGEYVATSEHGNRPKQKGDPLPEVILSFACLFTRIAPREIEPKHRLQIFLEYTLTGYTELSPSGELIAYANTKEDKYIVVVQSQQT